MNPQPHSGERITRVHYKELLQLSLSINTELDLRQLLDKIAHSTRDLMGCSDASIVLWCPRQACFELGASTNIGSTVSRRVRQSGGATRWVVDHGQPVVVPDTRRDPFVANPMIPQAGILAYIGVPIQQASRIWGVLYALYKREHEASSKEMWVMEQAAAIAAAAIRNADLVDSLRELNTFKSSMMRMLAHDLRNPLTALKGGIALLQMEMGCADPGFQELILIMEQSNGRMESLIDSVLNYEKINSLEEIERKRLDLNVLAHNTVSDLAEAASRKTQRLIAETSPQPVLVSGNQDMLREAVDNLVSNAIKCTPAGGSVTVFTREDGKDCLLAVADDGPGIAPEDQSKIFQPFFCLDTGNQKRGSGVGLSLVKLILERHNGKVEVTSSLGNGSTFSIRLPRFCASSQ